MKRTIRWVSVMAALGALGACQTVERTFTGKPRVERPVEVVYQFRNVKRTPTVNEWDNIRRVLYLHAKGSVDIKDWNHRRYDQSDLRDYVARFTVPDASHIAKINEEIDALAAEKVGGETLRFAMNKAEITFEGDNLGTSHSTILRGVTLPGATVKLFPASGATETTTDQYGAWAKYVSVSPGQDVVYGYAEAPGAPDRPPLRKYFRINVFSMEQEAITQAQFGARGEQGGAR